MAHPFRPCPFCGGGNFELFTDVTSVKLITCKTCGASPFASADENILIGAWNRRTEPWIKVSEQAPPSGALLLVCSVIKHVFVAMYRDGAWHDGVEPIPAHHITHWMYRPLPPEEADHDT